MDNIDELDVAEVLCDLEGSAMPKAYRAARLIRQMQAAMAEADRRGKAYMGHFREHAQCIVEPLQPHLPQPAPDPVVEAVRLAMNQIERDVTVRGLTDEELHMIGEAALHITEKKP